jgi:hypothetical protein
MVILADGRLSTQCGRSSFSEADIDGPHEPPPRRAKAGNGNDYGGDVVVNSIGRVSAI